MVDKISSMPPRRSEPVRSEGANRTDAARESHHAAQVSVADAKPGVPMTVSIASTNSASSSLIERAKAAAEHVPEVDRQKVDDIKQAIARGEFHINPKAVAQAFVSMTLNATR